MLKYILLFFGFALVISSYGQKEERDANYHFKQENYTVALKYYSDLIATDSANIEYNYRIGLCYLNCNQAPQKALSHLLVAVESFKEDGQFYFDLGLAYLYNHQFDDAIKSFEQCKVLFNGNEAFNKQVDVWISMTKNAKKYIQHPIDVSFVNLGKYINSEMDELTPIISPDDELLVYTSNQKYDSKFFYYYNNVYMAETDDGVFKKGKAVTSVNTMEDEFVAGFAMNGERLYVQLQGYEGFEDLFYTEKRGKSFQGKNKLGEFINSKSAEYSAMETLSGDTLYFSSNRPEGYGGLDIYYSLRLPTGMWSAPRNLGEEINTEYDEDFPMMSINGSTFYFCSNRPESMGGYDVFESKHNTNDRTFSKPVNLGYPLNDVYDNKTIAFSSNNRYAYVSAIRPDSYGYTDLYQVVFNQEDPSVKIFILELKTGTAEAPVLFAKQDTTIKVTALRSKVVFGEYAYNAESSEVAIALPPGSYQIEIQGKHIETKEIKLVVPDVPSEIKIEKETIYLNIKE